MFRRLSLLFLLGQCLCQQYSFPQRIASPQPLYPSYVPSTPTQPPIDDTCDVERRWTNKQKCDYVILNKDNCEGGGYLMWTQYVHCTSSTVAQVFVIIAAVLFMLVMFIHISTTADDFFSPNIAAIVAHLKIRESVAGVTFMAFGNGAPDIFGSIASIVSSPRPKAGLALGSLLGGGLFVSSCVLATIILSAKSFRVDVFGVVRDLSFYLLAVGWILFVFLLKNEILLFEPIVFLGLYVIYAVIVIVGTLLLSRWKKQRQKRKIHDSRRHSTATDAPEDPPQPIYIISDNLKEQEAMEGKECEEGQTELECEEEDDPEMEDVVVLHNHVLTWEEAWEEEELPPTFGKTWRWSEIPRDLAVHLNPWPSTEDWNESGRMARLMYFLRVPSQIVLKATVPRFEDGWSKPVTIFYVLVAPQFLLIAFHQLLTVPFKGSPGIWLYGLAISLIFILLIIVFTRMDTAPKYHKEVSSYVGFVMAVGWIYFTASEIVNAVTMIGAISGLSFEILGMTILAWSNSLGDFIADLSVVKQGFPRMAMTAATGGPLFNLLMGFGLSFTIAKARGVVITIAFTSALHFLVMFLGISLLFSLIAIFAQRFVVTKWHAFGLYAIYGAFLVMAILCEARVIVWQ